MKLDLDSIETGSYGPPTTPPSSSPVRSRVSFLFIEEIVKMWWLVLLLSILGFGLGWFYLQKQIPKFRSTSSLELDSGSRLIQVEGAGEVNVADPIQVNTLIQGLTSRPVLLRVNETLEYDKDPEVIGEHEPGSQEAKNQALEMLRQKVSARLRPGTRLIDISAVHTKPEVAAAMANAVGNAAVESINQSRGSQNEEASSFLLREAERLRERLQSSELAMQAYKSEKNAISLDAEKDLVLATLKDLGAQFRAASNRRLQLETELEACRKGELNESELLGVSTVAEHPKVAGILSQVVKLRGELEAISFRYLPKHPKHQALARELQIAEEQMKGFLGDVVNLLESAVAGAASLEGKVKVQLEEQQRQALDLEKLAVEYNSLKRDMETDSAIFESVLARLKEVDVATNQDKTPYRFHLAAEIPMFPFEPNPVRILTSSTGVGFVLALTLVVLMVTANQSIRSVEQAESFLQLPVIGTVVEEKTDETVGALAHQERRSNRKRRRASYTYASARGTVESFRTIRNMVSLLGPNGGPKVLALSSAAPAEGKSFCSAKLARSYAAQGALTLVIDFDLRRPSLHTYFAKGRDEPGAADVLLGKVPLLDAIQPVHGVEKLFYLGAGSRIQSPGEVVTNAEAVGKLFDEVRALNFQHIIVDTAPVLPVSDTLSLSRFFDSLLLVVACNRTPGRASLEAVNKLRSIGKAPMGLVLNRYREIAVGYYLYHRFYKSYHRYYDVPGTEQQTA
jgi:polysaccharide biosynthesis transport protein